MALLDQIGAEGYTNAADITTRTSFETSSLSVVSKNVLNITGEKWLTSSFEVLRRNWDTTYTNGNPANEIEVHAAVYIEDMIGTVSSTIPMVIVSPNNLFQLTQVVTAWVALYEDPLNPGEYLLRAGYNASSGVTEIETDIKAVAGSLYYVVVRMKGETDTLGDGQVEIWINNTLVLTLDNVTHHTAPAIANFAGDNTARLSAPFGAANKFFFRNFQVYTAWTTAFGVTPPLHHVIDNVPSDVTFEGGTTWTNEGGATDEVEALSDALDTTYVQTLEADAHTVVGFDRPLDLATQPTVNAVVRLRAARGTSAPNTIGVATVTDNTGATETTTSTQSLSVVGANRENITKVLEGVGGTKLFVKVTNGS